MASDTSPLFVIRAVAKAMWVTLFNLFRKPVTVHYPDKERVYPDRYRGLLALVYEKDTGEEACIGCRLCEYVCPPAVIKVEMLKSEKRNYAKSFSLELYAMARLPARTFAVMMSLEPALAVLSGLVLLGEFLSPAQIAGVALVIAAAAASAWSSSQVAEPAS